MTNWRSSRGAGGRLGSSGFGSHGGGMRTVLDNMTCLAAEHAKVVLDRIWRWSLNILLSYGKEQNRITEQNGGKELTEGRLASTCVLCPWNPSVQYFRETE